MLPRTEINLAELVHRQPPGHSLETPFYTNEAFLNLDLEAVWMRHWLYAGHVARIPNPGDFFLYTVGEETVIVIRGEDKQVRALPNVCQHRGSRICLEMQGNTKRLVCPYHQWVYDRDGTLLSAKQQPAEFDKSKFNLPTLPCRVLPGGFLFIAFGEEPPFDDFAAQVRPHLELYNLEETRVAAEATYVLTTNWKLLCENFRECYHCGVGHPEYCKIITGASQAVDWRQIEALKARKNEEWEARGIPAHSVAFEPGIYRYAERYPYEPGCVTMSLDGQPVAPILSEKVDGDVGAFSIVQYPNFWLDVNRDYAWTMRITPKTAETSEVALTWLVHKDAVEGRDYDKERLMAFWKTTGEQDWKLCEDTQAGVRSRFYRPFAYAPVENGPGQFIEWYLQQVRAALSL